MSTHIREIEDARKRLRKTVEATGAAFWEKTVDHHAPDHTEYGVWEENSERYVAEIVDEEADADYMVLMDPRMGALLDDLFGATLMELIQSAAPHGDCASTPCAICTIVRMARRINEES